MIAISDLTPMRLAWLVLALAGGIWSALVWSRPVGGEWVAVGALAIWCITETMLRRNWAALLTLPALVVGIGLALPLYLFIRSRRII